jgi:hypothetical protein
MGGWGRNCSYGWTVQGDRRTSHCLGWACESTCLLRLSLVKYLEAWLCTATSPPPENARCHRYAGIVILHGLEPGTYHSRQQHHSFCLAHAWGWAGAHPQLSSSTDLPLCVPALAQVQQLQERVAALTDEELLQDPAARLGTLPTSPRAPPDPAALLMHPGGLPGAPPPPPGAPPALPLAPHPHHHHHHHHQQQLPYPGASVSHAGGAAAAAADVSGPLYAALMMGGASAAPSSLGEVPPGGLLGPPGRTTPTYPHPMSSKSLPLQPLKSGGPAPSSLVGAHLLPAPQLVIPTPGVVAWLPDGCAPDVSTAPAAAAGVAPLSRGPSAPQQQQPPIIMAMMHPSPYAQPGAQQYGPTLAPPFPVGGAGGPPLTPHLAPAPAAQAMMARAHSNEAGDQAAADFYVIGNTAGSLSSANVVHLGPAGLPGGGSVSATSAGGGSRSGTSGTTHIVFPLASPRIAPRTSGSITISGAASLPGAHHGAAAAAGSSQLSLGTVPSGQPSVMLPAGGSSGAGPGSSTTGHHAPGGAGPSTGGTAGGPPHRLSPASSTSTFGLSTLVGQPSVAGQVSTHSAVSGGGGVPRPTPSTTGHLSPVSGSLPAGRWGD